MGEERGMRGSRAGVAAFLPAAAPARGTNERTHVRTEAAHMRVIALMNQKGGVGKTTTTVNLGAALAEQGQRVCLIDLDPQAHLTINYGVEPSADHVSLYDVLVEDRSFLE